MNILINLRLSSTEFICESILPTVALWNNVNPDSLLLTFGEKPDLNADLNIDIINTNQIRVGFLPENDSNAELNSSPKVELHWLTISEPIPSETNMLIIFLTFLVGLVKTPSQMGTYMVDLIDLKKVMEFGNEATLICFEDYDIHCQVSSIRPLSSAMLLNSDSSISMKLSMAGSLTKKNDDGENYLGILNITEASFLPRNNMVLFINKS